MPFHFSLQSVYQLRRSIEHQQELRLRAANQQLTKIRRLIEQNEGCIRESDASSSRELQTGTTSAELRFVATKQRVLLQRGQELQYELGRCQTARDQQQRIFEKARRERETVENLRDWQFQEFSREQSRREQRRLDELFLLRKSRSTRG
ncbi:MAG TPA: flagellar export protein FliJ [Candidatus Sulfotelmatobacter sp.]|nr:flagellar export protein FliJ [Candidatus Sulfotelmatobacter sp.]